MFKTKTVLISLAFLSLTACAAQRPQMTDENYVTFSKGWAAIHHCGREGWMDVDTVARGRTYVVSAMNRYSFDPQRMDAESLKVIRYGVKPDERDCRDMAISVQQRKQQIDHQNATADIQHQTGQNMLNATKPTQTYCNKVGTQVLCNSF